MAGMKSIVLNLSRTLSRSQVHHTLACSRSSLSSLGRGLSTVKFTFTEAKSNDKIEVLGTLGKTVMETAVEHNIDIEGACGGELACSTCHVIVSQSLYDKLPPKKEEEQDMLDLAWGVTDTSRLCCQIKVTPLIAGENFTVPSETNNML